MEYIYIVKVNNNLKFLFEDIDDALTFISNSMDAEIEYNTYEIHQEEVDG